MRFREIFRRFGKNQSGAVAAEFAIVGTLSCVLIFVMIQMGMMFYSYNVMQNGARDGARRLALDEEMNPAPAGFVNCIPGDPTGTATVEAYTCEIMQLFANAVVRACITGSEAVGRYDAEVVVTADLGDVGIFDLFDVTSGFTMTASAVMRVEASKEGKLETNGGTISVCGTSLMPV
jgi:hypothetical protein